MDRYCILKKDKFENEEKRLQKERADKGHWYYFDHVEKLCRFMFENSMIWIPVQLNSTIKRFRAIDNVKSALIYTGDYDTTKHLLPSYLRKQFEEGGVIVFKETDKIEKASYFKE